MAIPIGTQLGSYEITALLGKGGMGEVYRAKDSKLKRDVAIKTLPDQFSRDYDRVSRFQREAEVLASLNHPNIAAIYDLQEANGSRFLVLELVEGDTLADRITRGPIPVEEALEIGKLLCSALEAAHEKGVIHRDLKPANIKITFDGKVKVLDFGLAKAMETGATVSTLSNSPTMLSETLGGMIMGTAAYISPEQARGRPVDRRADIFAFGCVLYEMLSGRPAFDGEDVTEILGRVVTAEPDWSRIPAGTPVAVRRVLRRSLKKEPRERLGDIRDARLEIEDAFVDAGEVKPPAAQGNVWRTWAIAAVALLMVGVLAIPVVNHLREVSPPEMRLQIDMPPTRPNDFALSPDGRYIVFVSSADNRLWLRPLDRTEAQPMAGTEGASSPFWSDDSRSIGFFTPTKLCRIEVTGGLPKTLANVSYGYGGTWNTNGIIVYSPGGNTPLWRVTTSGDEPAPITQLNTPGQAAHRRPQFLPDGRHFVFNVVGSPEAQGLYIGSLDGGEPKKLGPAIAGAYLNSGYMVFIQQGALVAQRLDTKLGELTGDLLTLADPIEAFSVSATGIVAYRAAGAGQRRQLTWVARTGKVLGTANKPDAANLSYAELSPDASRVAVQRSVEGNPDIWLLDLQLGAFTRFTFDEANDNVPLFSPDGTQIAFDSSRRGPFNLYLKLSSGAVTEKLLLETPYNKGPQDWSDGGRFLLYYEISPKSGRDLWALEMIGNNQKTLAVANTPFEERNAQFSPDVQWVAYETNESGQFEIVVQSFPLSSVRRQVSSGGGIQPRWRADSKELYFIASDSKLMAVSITTDTHQDKNLTVVAGKPEELFPTRIVGGFTANGFKHQYSVSRDGRFLINRPTEESTTAPITVLLNWKPPRKSN